MESETRRKIEETVLDVLKNSNVDEATEFTVRLAASERLGIDLCVSEHKLMVRGIVESYLLAIAEEEGGRVPASEPSAPQETREVMQDEQEAKPNKEVKEDSERIICQLSNKRNVVVHDFRGKRLVSIRDYYQKDGKQFPSAKGISLSTDQWSVFKKSVPAIEEAITKMGSEVYGKQNGDVPKPNLDAPPLDLVSAASPPEPVPIEISRFDGKNYHLWVQQMESLLKQLKIAYVLTELCPNATPGPHASAVEVAEARAAEKRWVSDDFMCRRNILCYLSDHLFNQYTNRKMTAKELWEELRQVYLYEEFGTKRSQVKKYIEFKFVGEKSILEQVLELNTIADSIVSAGMMIDENFHVSVLISKLPPSWKDVCIKLMCEEYLPFWMLMERLRVEEESRNQVKQGDEPSSNDRGYHEARKFVQRWADIKPSSMYGQRNRLDMNGRSIVCYVCGKKGHLSRNCWRRFDSQAREKRIEENGPSAPVIAQANMVGVSE
ncbi:uncharacterized protein LOC129288773 isoform X2 [Prosopis cineraria]|uniref:uncharacterized protein LOC129288773 isoform X2 n=1 Tax=Prosopis cineraria TaxID=364024 RepID=UPI002410B61C|nr:uncharacterized protein LOC129288773 isoform X2 [Prosopis cineraria]